MIKYLSIKQFHLTPRRFAVAFFILLPAFSYSQNGKLDYTVKQELMADTIHIHLSFGSIDQNNKDQCEKLVNKFITKLKRNKFYALEISGEFNNPLHDDRFIEMALRWQGMKGKELKKDVPQSWQEFVQTWIS